MRLALPVVALLLMVDVALALLGRLNQQLQLLSLAFPLKMLTALLVLSWMAPLFPRILLEFSGHAWAAARRDVRVMTRHGGPQRKTEEPTQRRLEKARKDGQFPQAKEFVGGAAVPGVSGPAGVGRRRVVRAAFDRRRAPLFALASPENSARRT